MLSENLRCLYSRLADYEGSGVVLHDAAVTGILAVLKAAIEDAEELEARPVPPTDQSIGTLPANVVKIASILARKGVKTGSGDAA